MIDKKTPGKSPLESLWGQRVAGLDFSKIDPFRPITASEIETLRNRYPFLQMVNTGATFTGQQNLKYIYSDTGWYIYDYGNAMSTSTGKLIFGGGDSQSYIRKILASKKDEKGTGDEGGDDNEGDAIINPGKGTIIKQMVDISFEMIRIAAERDWEGVLLVDGTPLMKWAAWYEAQEKKMELEGFDPDNVDRAKADRLRKILITGERFTLEF